MWPSGKLPTPAPVRGLGRPKSPAWLVQLVAVPLGLRFTTVDELPPRTNRLLPCSAMASAPARALGRLTPPSQISGAGRSRVSSASKPTNRREVDEPIAFLSRLDPKWRAKGRYAFRMTFSFLAWHRKSRIALRGTISGRGRKNVYVLSQEAGIWLDESRVDLTGSAA